MKQITVVVHGALGKVGREIIAGVSRDPDLSLVGAVDIQATRNISICRISARQCLWLEI